MVGCLRSTICSRFCLTGCGGCGILCESLADLGSIWKSFAKYVLFSWIMVMGAGVEFGVSPRL